MKGHGIKKRTFGGVDNAFGTIKEFDGVIEYDDIVRKFKVFVSITYKYIFGGLSSITEKEEKSFTEIEEVIDFFNTIVEVVR